MNLSETEAVDASSIDWTLNQTLRRTSLFVAAYILNRRETERVPR